MTISSLFCPDEAIHRHHEVLLGTFFSKCQRNPHSIQVESNVNSEWAWEYYYPLEESPDFKNIKTAIYTPHTLSCKTYERLFTDSWMVIDIDHQQAIDSQLNLVKVAREEELIQFIKALYFAYSSFNEQDPYGTLGIGYKEALLSSFKTKQTKLDFFYLLINNTIAAVWAVGTLKPYSFGYCFGVTPPFRNTGIYKLLLRSIKTFSKQNDCNFLVIQTAQNSIVESINLKHHFSCFKILNYYRPIDV